MRQLLRLALTSAVGLSLIPGCCATRQGIPISSARPSFYAPCPSCNAGGPVAPRFVPAPPGPLQGITPPPPNAVDPSGIAPAATFPPPDGAGTAPLPPGPTAPPALSENGTTPNDSGVRLSPPVMAGADPMPPAQTPTQPTPPRQSEYSNPAQTPEPPRASIPPANPPANPPEPDSTPLLPVDIPQFAMVKPGIASGQQPFSDGLAWLKEHGYRTVLHVRGPGEADAAAQREFEKLGLRYLSLEVSPSTLSRDVLNRFNQIVADEKLRPLFVYDHDGTLAGGLWYLHFRLAENASDEKARAEAARLGFKQDQDNEHRLMWLAIQNFLKNQRPGQ